MVRIADIEFFIVARNDEQLAILHEGILKQQADAPFNPDAVQPVILISSKTLPEPKPTNEQNSAS